MDSKAFLTDINLYSVVSGIECNSGFGSGHIMETVLYVLHPLNVCA